MHFRILKMIATSSFLTALDAPNYFVLELQGLRPDLPRGRGGDFTVLPQPRPYSWFKESHRLLHVLPVLSGSTEKCFYNE